MVTQDVEQRVPGVGELDVDAVDAEVDQELTGSGARLLS
jgi:hypothetical protein